VTTREKIIDAAETVMRRNGLVAATTKAIAREAGYSEAMLYKTFSDKPDLYLAVLRERGSVLENPADLVGRRDVEENLVDITRQLMRMYVESFPLMASVFASPELLAAWREGMTAGRGPRSPIKLVERYLDGEIELGRIDRDIDAFASASLLCGAAFQHAFFAGFDGLRAVPDERDLAGRLVKNLALS
jgi:AcrR family transcriptional regulator